MNTSKQPGTAAEPTGPYGSTAKPAALPTVLHEGAAEIKETLGHMAQGGKGAIGQMVHEGKSRVADLVDEGQTRVGDWKSGIGDAVRDRPFQSLLIVAGIGAVLGVLVGRRSA